ncbi:MAG TPA: hypothetical protein VL946_09985, partial [Lacibacter sp.]|nr:hypothetical protein [Lacibacter sp.]
NNFKECIRVKVTPTVPGLIINENNITYVFAKNVGMILNKIRFKVTMLAMDVDTETKLGAFVIK